MLPLINTKFSYQRYYTHTIKSDLYFILKLITETGMRIGTLLNMNRKDRDGVNNKEGVYVYKVLSKHKTDENLSEEENLVLLILRIKKP